MYTLSKKAVVKLPFQYPICDAPCRNTANEHLYMSLRSFAVFKKESAFYDLVALKPHPNIAQRQRSKHGIVLEYLHPLEHFWDLSTKEMRLGWIQELVSALGWIEGLGYAHGDIKIQNMGIDFHRRLKLFDFGFIVHRDDPDFDQQVLEDRFKLATCIHFLASGVDFLAKAESFTQLRQTIRDLKEGKGIINEAAKEFKGIIQEGWTGQLRSALADIQKDIAPNRRCHPEDKSLLDLHFASDYDWVVKEEPRWMNEEDYRAAWKKKGFESPGDILN